MQTPRKLTQYSGIILRYVLVLTLLSGCAAQRQPIPAGVVPEQQEVSISEEQYGHQVFSQLSEHYPLDRDDARINRTREIVDRLTSRIKNNNNIWHVYVLVDDNLKNAAATRGNYIFVWTGMLKTARNDAELAAVLAHEIGHVLAGHTRPTPTEEVNDILSQVAKVATRSAVSRSDPYSALAGLAAVVVEQAVKAVIVNPETQRKELEADTIGLFLMADAGYDPAAAFEFWQRLKDDPAFAEMPLEFLSSHPSSVERIENLKENLPAAQKRFRKETSEPDLFTIDQDNLAERLQRSTKVTTVSGEEIWEVADDFAPVYSDKDPDSTLLLELPRGYSVAVQEIQQRWIKITDPVHGFSPSFHFSPRR